MRLRPLVALAVALSGVLVAGCGPTAPVSQPTLAAAMPAPAATASAAAPVLPVTVTDVHGVPVSITDVSRIVSLSGGVSELLVELGLLDRVVGRDVTSEAPGMSDVPLVSQGHDVSAEAVLGLRPTVVLADQDSGPPEALDAIAQAGVPVVVFASVWNFADAADRARAVATAVGLDAQGASLADSIGTPDEVLDRPRTVAFLYLRGSASVYLIAGEGSGADDVIEAIGGVDAGSRAGLSGYTPLTPEALVAVNPEIIVVMQGGLDSVGGIDGLLAIPGLAQTDAGTHRRVVAVPDADLLSFGPRSPSILGDLARAISDLD